MTLSDGTEIVLLGGGDPDTCGEDPEGIEEYDVANDRWDVADRFAGTNPAGPSVQVI